MKKNILIVINDFRGYPILSALSIAKMHKGENISFIYSKKFLKSNEYGQNLPSWYKQLKLSLLKLFYNVIVSPELFENELNEAMAVGVSSSLQSITCDSGAMPEKYPILYSHLLQQAIGSNEIAKFICDLDLKPNCVYLFNGRTASSSSITHKLHYANIQIKYYEFSIKSKGFLIFPFPCHNSIRIGQELYNLWRCSIKSNPDIFKQGVEYENNKLNNNYTSHYSENIFDTYDIVVFLGSDHEYTNLQLDIVEMKVIGNLKLLEYVIEKYGIEKKIAVRAHPNQSNDPNRNLILKPIIEMCKKYEFNFFEPESGVSSYDLINKSDLVVVEYSSIAYDAIFLGAEVDIVGDLALKSIIDLLPENIKNNKIERKNYSREILSFSMDLCHYSFPNTSYDYIARAFTYIERNYLNKKNKTLN
jgi:hypothetical protein